MNEKDLAESLGVAQITAEDLKAKLARKEPVFLLDVREPDELITWPFSTDLQVPLGAVIQGRPEKLPEHVEVVTICSHGNRSAVAAATLLRRGVQARSLRGGLAAWNQVFDEAPLAIDGIEVVQFRRLGKGCLSYLLFAGKEALSIDPSWQTTRYREASAARGAAIRSILDTHLHADHVSGARQLQQETAASLYLNPLEGFQFDGFEPVGSGRIIKIGPIAITAIAAPGHTVGGLVWNLRDRAIFTSDVLFLESVGRPDLHGQAQSYAHDLFHTLQRVAQLPQHLLVLPGHMPSDVALEYGKPYVDTLGGVRGRVKVLDQDEAAFVAQVANVPDPPPNAERILAINRQGIRIVPEEAGVLEEGPNRCGVKTLRS